MFRAVCLFIGYVFGCLQIAYLVGQAAARIDIRKHGSGNAGTTNVFRVLGPKHGFLVFTCDILKGMIPFLICSWLFQGSSAYFTGQAELGLLPGLYGGLGAVLGHNFPIHQKFKGGKGIATSIGVIFWMDWRVALICYFCGALAVALTRYVSLASLMILGLFPVLLFAFGYSEEVVLIGLFMGAMAYFQHRGNIRRLLDGNERRFSFQKQINIDPQSTEKAVEDAKK